ncbi:hypothetical protein PCC8801_3463 [Rippkaea orientalis PCC 8801]|uniref:Uncharacterized protein n=1 Tax=Rippkaea orientalis (strain PCC 8801 / RF-1) TaxID=41431 RepID=B7K0E5_RIPO1|nr:hypothetical protein [Rippkaea orientalis]ACK67429.1 hypothetical protein PCC8801_3463 [Rippkaea orientalis PCC 8801]
MIAKSLMTRTLERFDQNFNFLIENKVAIALFVRVLEIRNYQGSPRVTKESYLSSVTLGKMIAKSLMTTKLERFDQNFDFLIENKVAIALFVRVLELRNHQVSPRVTKESYMKSV